MNTKHAEVKQTLTPMSPSSLRLECEQESFRMCGTSQKKWPRAFPWHRGKENVLAVCSRALRKPLAQAAAAMWAQALLPRRVL